MDPPQPSGKDLGKSKIIADSHPGAGGFNQPTSGVTNVPGNEGV